jgi:hypothetical protein
MVVIHTFAFRWKPSATDAQKQRAIHDIRALQGKIPGLLESHVGLNFSSNSLGYQLGGMMKFTDRSALVAYGEHPVHKDLLSWLLPLIDPMEVDFESMAF